MLTYPPCGLDPAIVVRSVVVAQARRETQATEQRVIALTPAELQAFWPARQEPTALTAAQQALGAQMRGELQAMATGC